MIINGNNLHLETRGPDDGFPVILLHHGLGSMRAWKGQIPALVEAGYRVIAYDRWGYGSSDPRPQLSVPTFEEDQQDLGALLDALKIEQAALVSHSDGATIALHFAARNPWRVACLVSIAAHIYVEPDMKAGIQSVRQVYLSDPRFLESLRRVHGEKAQAVFQQWYDGWFRKENLDWDMRPLLGQVSCPVLVVQGSQDEYATPQHALDLAAALPDAECWVEPGAGHMLPQEEPEKINPLMLEFLRVRIEDERRRTGDES